MEGKLVIFSAPSGAGKTSIVKGVLPDTPQLEFSVSACSRPMRSGEKNGVDYYFLTPDAFRAKIKEDAFLEWEEVYPGSFYGTLRSEVDRIWESGKHVVFDVDVAGGLNIKKQFPEQSLAIFIQPPSLEELEKRLINRKTETQESLKHRMEKAAYELKFSDHFDQIIVNNDLQTAINETKSLVHSFLGINPRNDRAHSLPQGKL